MKLPAYLAPACAGSAKMQLGVRALRASFLIAGFLAGHAAAGEFSADVLQRGPQGMMSHSRMYVSGDRVREEVMDGGRRLVRIRDAGLGREWILHPAEYAYVEVPVSQGNPLGRNPCSGLPGATCEKLGDEEISGRPVTRFAIDVDVNGQTVRSEYWIDSDRGIALRERMPDGATTQWRLHSVDRIEGRYVEKWQVTTERRGEAPVMTFRWIDPELEIPVKEELPGGFVRELRQIRVGPQPDHLFTVPLGYRQFAGQGSPGVGIP
jgi:hypothetical protein